MNLGCLCRILTCDQHTGVSIVRAEVWASSYSFYLFLPVLGWQVYVLIGSHEKGLRSRCYESVGRVSASGCCGCDRLSSGLLCLLRNEKARKKELDMAKIHTCHTATTPQIQAEQPIAQTRAVDVFARVVEGEKSAAKR